MSTPDPSAAALADNARRQQRRRGFLLLGLVILLGMLGWGMYDIFLAGAYETTDNAYVAGDVVAITAREGGVVTAIHATDTERVRAGQILVELDPATADAAMAAAEANLARSVRNVRSNFLQVDAARAEVTHAATTLARAENDLRRRRDAADAGAVSGEELAHAEDAVATARAAHVAARARLEQARSLVQGTSVETNPDVLASIAAVRRAAIVQSHMRLIAPVDGVVANRSVQLGQQVAPGARLMAVVPLQQVWIDANFRETQLKDLRIGQPATIAADIYGNRVTYHGRVAGLGAGSGNAFALLPPQNASGNWIKISQRLPVRITLDPAELHEYPLRIGLSAHVRVDVADTSGSPVARLAETVSRQRTSLYDDAAVKERIAGIIAANRGTTAR